MQGRLIQELKLELEAAEHRAELQTAELQQRLRLSEETCAAGRSDVGRLKQEQNEDARMMEVQASCARCIPCLCLSYPAPQPCVLAHYLRQQQLPWLSKQPAQPCAAVLAA